MIQKFIDAKKDLIDFLLLIILGCKHANMEPQSPPSAPKQMHGCLGAYLTLMLLSNVLMGIVYLSSLGAGQPSKLPKPLVIAMVLGCMLNTIFAIALFKWKKWGFYGFIGTSVIIFIINLSLGLGPMSLLGLTGVPILYGVLKIGKERAGWDQLD